MRRTLSALVLVVAGALAPATSAFARSQEPVSGPAAGRIGIRLIDAPLSEIADPRAQLYIIDHLAPGTVIHRKLEVTNFSPSAQSVAVYPAAATIGNGSFTGAPGRTQNEVSQWTRMSRDVLSLAPGATAIDGVTISVPRNASRGEQYAVIWAQVASRAPAGGGVTAVNRVGIRIYLSVGPGGLPPTNFTINSLTAKRLANGQPLILAHLHNTGGRAIDMSGQLSLSDGPGGLRAGPFNVLLGTTLAPGQSEPVTAALDKRLPDGPWRALIDLKSGLTDRRAEATIQFPSRAGAASSVRARPVAVTTHYLTSAAVLLTTLALLAALAVFVARRRRRPARAPGGPAQG